MHKNNHKLRIGIVGAGNIVRTRHLPALKKNPDVEIVAVSNSTYESSERFCRENSLEALPIRDWASCCDAGYRHRLDRHNAVHAFGSHNLCA
jgi:Predicted dehydrogenases and related proteins